MPNKTSFTLNQKRSSRRKTVASLAVAASLGLVAGCSGGNNSSTDLDMGGGGGDQDMTLPVDPPPGKHRVTVTISGTGTGSVTSQPAGITCSAGSATCAADFTEASQVSLTAAGANGSSFTGWSGACAGQGAVCKLAVNADLSTAADFGPASCSSDGVCWEAPLPFGYDLNAVTAISATDVWAVGNAGAAVRYNGQRWSRVATGTTANLTDIWARNANDIWAIGTTGGEVLHWTGSAWVKMTTGAFTDIGSAIWGTATQVFIGTGSGALLVYNGTTWSRPSVSPRNDTLFSAITGTGNSDIWAFGADSHICHFTTAWSCVRPDLGGPYSGTSAAIALSANDVWEALGNKGYVLRSTTPSGATYGFPAPADTPAIKAASSISGLWGTGNTAMFTNGPAATMLRFDGTKWNTNATGVLDITSMNKLHGTSASDVWSVGGRGVIAHYNGTSASVNRANIFTGNNITSVWASGANDAWFTTSAGTVVHYDGAAFVESAPLVTGGGATLKTIWGTAADDIWVGGSDGQVGVLRHWDGRAWALVPQPLGFTSIDTVYAASKTLAFASGGDALGVERWNGIAWSIDTDASIKNVTSPITKIWGSSDVNVFAIERDATKLRVYNGVSWAVDNRLTATVTALGGSSQADVWAGTTQGVYHLDGTAWSAKTTIAGSVGSIKSVSSASATNAWAVDSTGNVFRTENGTTWKLVDTGVTNSVNAAINTYSVNANLTWLAGRSGILSVRK